jgi:hypothetical protein
MPWCEASSLRLRPIMMTTGAMVLGALPLALATGAGAESRQQIGWVIVGGMAFGTLLTVFVVPTVYTLFARNRVPGEIKTPSLDDEGCSRARLQAACTCSRPPCDCSVCDSRLVVAWIASIVGTGRPVM